MNSEFLRKIKIFFLFMIFATVFFFQETYAAEQNSKSAIMLIYKDINTFRATHGLAPLKFNNLIYEQARKHTLDMANDRVPFGHSGFRKRGRQLLRQFKHSRVVAENVAEVRLNPERAIAIWLNSPPHKKNILGNYKFTGISVIQGKNGRFYLTQMFLR
jgi:uncharacterized protein YkwD